MTDGLGDSNCFTRKWIRVDMDSELVTRFGALWETGDASPDVFTFLTEHADADDSERLAVLLLSSTVGSEAWNSRDLKSRPH